MIIKKILPFIKTFISLISINILIHLKKKNKKIIFFYFPVKIYQEHLIKIINKINKKSLVILAYNSSSKTQIKKFKNSFFIEFNYIKFIPFANFFLKDINLFISSYLMYHYPPNSKNIYISHDIYDAPMINSKLEKKIFIQINKLDYILLSSKISIEYFKSKFNFYNIKIKPELLNIGYPKLDHVYKKIKNTKKNKKNEVMLIAPGYSLHYKKYNMYQSISKIISTLMSENNNKIIYRPHPLDLTHKGQKKLIYDIIDKFKIYKNFKVDLSVSYINSYLHSKMLITDLSSIAYTYAFATEKPVIFFSKNENELKKNKFLKTNYIQDRKKIGTICANQDKIIKSKNKIELNYNNYVSKIKILRNKRIKYFEKSTQETENQISNILKDLNLINH